MSGARAEGWRSRARFEARPVSGLPEYALRVQGLGVTPKEHPRGTRPWDAQHAPGAPPHGRAKDR
ncbi:hypothetical protein GCM10010361_02530 [Streptomyces olivaceiscleroticus]|uniref:Uncharacterized protein n=1 Tax=Streptomyces olivaceiscleroticus TaxID=68245 RepID=A0ABN0ZB49_9ACTN